MISLESWFKKLHAAVMKSAYINQFLTSDAIYMSILGNLVRQLRGWEQTMRNNGNLQDSAGRCSKAHDLDYQRNTLKVFRRTYNPLKLMFEFNVKINLGPEVDS